MREKVAELRRLIGHADSERLGGRWPTAQRAYLEAAALAPAMPAIRHNLALCQLAQQDYEGAARSAAEALRLDPALWQARVVRVKALRRIDRVDEALAEAQAIGEGAQPLADLERAQLLLHELGDAAGAARLVEAIDGSRLAGLPEASSAEASLTAAIASLYDPGTRDADTVNAAFRAHARAHLGADRPAAPMTARAKSRGRPRVGVLSPQFCASPVYFFGIGALNLLAAEVDLVFLDRGARRDWATAAFRAIAADWREVAGLQPDALEAQLRSAGLDALVDMGGWMDAGALKALAGKPVPKMYKWIGGQSVTTGLRSFDGFVGDAWQSPAELQYLYTEPLLQLPSGYVTYTAPPYMPAPRAADPGLVIGVISNPLKASREFLAFVAGAIRNWQRQGAAPVLRFIDKRYRHETLRRRVAAALGLEGDEERVRFIAPGDHRAYLAEVGRLSAVIDTFPYSGGLTTMEALRLGVPCYTKPGRLFCERHTWAHCKYAGIEESAFELRADSLLMPQGAHSAGARASLVPDGSPRTDHEALARALLELVAS